MGNNMIKRINNPEHDFYETPACVTRELLKHEKFDTCGHVWEPACGNGAIVRILLEECRLSVSSSDIIKRKENMDIIDFLKCESDGDFVKAKNMLRLSKPDYIITNPPFKLALPFVQQALKFARKKVAMLLPIQFYESQGRYQFFKEYPPVRIYVFFNRVNMIGCTAGMRCFCWFVWEIGHKGPTTIIPILSKG